MATKIETIVKEHKVKNKETGEVSIIKTEYRIDAGFVPTSIGDIAPEFVENWCAANGKIDWLVEQVQKTIIDKNGSTKDLPFVNLRANFVKEFFPSIIVGTKKKETFKDKILAKYKK